MTITLMLSKSEPNSLSKELKAVATYTGTLRAQCSIIDPVIEIQLDTLRLNISQCNYLYIPDFKRYYFIKNITVIRQNLWQISCHVDVLYTYADYIKQLPALVSRSGLDSPYIEDDKVVYQSAPYIVTKTFPESLSDKQYLVTLIGADGQEATT